MAVLYPPDFIPSIKNKHLLLDTNVIRDSVSKPTDYRNFFNELKRENVTIVTTDFVKYEILKGSANKLKYDQKVELIDDIIDACLPITKRTYELAHQLILEYKIDGAALSITDLILGALLYQYDMNLYLLTRDTTDFPQRIFQLLHVINMPNNKGIHTYGVYQKP